MLTFKIYRPKLLCIVTQVLNSFSTVAAAAAAAAQVLLHRCCIGVTRLTTPALCLPSKGHTLLHCAVYSSQSTRPCATRVTCRLTMGLFNVSLSMMFERGALRGLDDGLVPPHQAISKVWRPSSTIGKWILPTMSRSSIIQPISHVAHLASGRCVLSLVLCNKLFPLAHERCI